MSCLFRVNAGDNITPVIENMSSGTDAEIHSINVIIERVGN